MKKFLILFLLCSVFVFTGCVSTTSHFGEMSKDDVRGLVFFDTETTGLNAETNRIIEITMFSEEGWFSTLVNPGVPVPPRITEITGISSEMLKDAPTFAEIAPEVYRRLDGRTAVAHNARFDMNFTIAEIRRAGIVITNGLDSVCTLQTERRIRNSNKNNTLTECIGRRGLVPENAHRSEIDVRSLIELYKCQKREGVTFEHVVY